MINLVLKQHMINIVLRFDFRIEYHIKVLHFTWNYNVRKESRWLKRKKNKSGFKCRSSHSDVFLGKDVLKNAANLQENTHAQENTTLQHGRSPVNLIHIFRTLFYKEHLWRAASANHTKINKSLRKQRCISSQI